MNSNKGQEPKYKLGQKVWAVYPVDNWQESLHMNPRKIVGISISQIGTRYEIDASTRNGFSGYCNIPESYIFLSREDALEHLKDVRLNEIKEKLKTHESISYKLRDEIRHQEQEIQEWSHESNS